MRPHTYENYGLDELLIDIATLSETHSNLMTETIGRSVLGKPIVAIRIGEGDRRLHINAAFHGNEWMTTLVLMKFMEDLAEAGSSGKRLYGYDARTLLKETTIWAVPMVNPDGVELAVRGLAIVPASCQTDVLRWNGGSVDFTGWKANIRGVDLNDQFPAGWEAERDRRTVWGPSNRDYGGEKPLSEPEAQAMAEFVRLHRFDAVYALHTQGEEIYWNYRGYEPADAEQAAERLAAASGYRAVKLIDSDAGFKDWFIQEYRKLGFTIELGIGINPLPIGHFSSIYDKAAPLLLEALSIY